LIAIASSELPWTGNNAFSLVGYSLGGGIAAAFADAFPNLLHSLILIAPSGLVKLRSLAWSSKFLYQADGLVPESIL
jgi:pimeloyl-ACP methyl ester carboxylesterase